MFPYLSPTTKQQYDKRHHRIYTVASDWTKREYPASGVSRNIKLKIVGDTGSSYIVPEPDIQRFETEVDEYHRELERGNTKVTPPILHYVNGPVINMNKWQRQMQREGKLPGCIANCGVPPVGSVEPIRRRGKLLGTQFPDADEVMNHYQSKLIAGAQTREKKNEFQ